jgi:hypothetical protein
MDFIRRGEDNVFMDVSYPLIPEPVLPKTRTFSTMVALPRMAIPRSKLEIVPFRTTMPLGDPDLLPIPIPNPFPTIKAGQIDGDELGRNRETVVVSDEEVIRKHERARLGDCYALRDRRYFIGGRRQCWRCSDAKCKSKQGC